MSPSSFPSSAFEWAIPLVRIERRFASLFRFSFSFPFYDNDVLFEGNRGLHTLRGEEIRGHDSDSDDELREESDSDDSGEYENPLHSGRILECAIIFYYYN